MPLRTAIWKVAAQPELLPESSLANEQLLEDMIAAAPGLLSDEWMLIGRQVDTGFGGRVDLLAIAPDASLVLIELKRDRTPREVVAQSLDYASWVEKLHPEDIAAIYDRFAPGRSLAQDFRHRFGEDLDEESLNQSHQIIIVASSLDDSTERIVTYLSERDIPINVLCFQVFTYGTDQLLSRVWLVDLVRTQMSAAVASGEDKEPWNGEFYVNFGDGGNRSWADAVQYGFISAGGGARYTKPLQLLRPGERIWVKVPRIGFVGVARVTGLAQPIATFKVTTPSGESAILDVAKGFQTSEWLNDSERCEWLVAVKWLQTAPLDNAVQEIGLFGNQLIVCKPKTPKWRYTVERLKKEFPDFDK